MSRRFNAFMLRLMLGLAVLLQVEGIAHAAMGMRHALAGAVEVCTTEGMKRITVDPALASSDSGSGQAQPPAQDHCPACSALGAWTGATPARHVTATDEVAAVPFSPLQPARTAVGHADHAARAPPFLR